MKALILSVLLLATVGVSTSAADCVDYGQYLHFVTRLHEIGADAEAVTLEGNIAYVARSTTYAAGIDFQCVDMTDPFNPVVLGGIDTGQHGFDVQVSGDYAYLASPTLGVHVIEVTNPALPSAVGFYPNAEAFGVCVDGSTLYVTARPGGLVSVDVSVPTNPTALDTITFGTDAWQVTTRGAYAYVAIAGGGLAVVDIADPANMSVVSTIDLNIFARSVELDGDYAYVGGGSAFEGLVVVDVADPNSPAEVGSVTGPGCRSVIVDGSKVLAAASLVNVYDVSTPAAPVHVVACDMAAGGTGGHAMVIGTSGLAGDFLVTAAGSSGLEVSKLGVADAPPRFGVYTGAGDVYNCRPAGNRVVMQTFNPRDVQVIDVTNPASPTLLGTAALPQGAAVDLDVSDDGNYAVVPYFDSFGPYGYAIFDVSGAPALVTTRTIPYRPERCNWDGGYLYMTDSWNSPGRLVIYDVNNPASPVWQGAVPIGDINSSVGGVDVIGDYAYVAVDDPYGSNTGLAIVDVSDRTAPSVAGITTSDVEGNEVAVVGNYAYVVEHTFGPPRLATVNVSNPSAPVIEQVEWLANGGTSIAATATHLYVGVFQRGVQVFDIRNPASPAVFGNLHSGDRSWDVAVDGQRVYVASEAAGMEMYDLQCDVASGVLSTGGAPPAARITRAWPNPFNPQTTIAFELPNAGRARIAIYDVAGRLVSVLADGVYDAGATEVRWNGRSQAGGPVSSGVYFVRLDTGRATDTMKIVNLK